MNKRPLLIAAALITLAALAPAARAQGFVSDPKVETGVGAPGDAAYGGSGNASVIAGAKGIYGKVAAPLGPVAPGTVAAASVLAGCQFNSGAPTVANLQQVALQCDASGRLLATIAGSLPAGSATIGAVNQAGTWTVQPGNTANTTPWLFSLNQGGNTATISAGGALKVDGSAATQPVSGTVTANAGTGTFATSDSHYPAAAALSDALANPTTTVLGSNNLGWDATNSVWRRLQVDAGTGTLKVDGSGATQPVSGSITANIGTTNGLALDTSVNGLLLSQGSTSSGQKGPLAQGAVTTGAPTYTTGQTSPLSLDPSGGLRVSIISGGGSGGTASSFAAAFPATGTAIGVKNGANMVNLTADASNNLNVACASGCSSPADVTAALSGMTANNAATQITLQGTNTVSVLLSGTWTATLTPEISVDGGTTWLATQFYRPDTQAFVSTVSANGTYNIAGTAGASHARVRISSFTSGTVTGNLRAVSQAPNAIAAQLAAPLPAGSNSIGTVVLGAGSATIGALTANQSVNAAQIAGTATAVGNGTTTAGTQRVTLSSDSTGQVAIAGTATVAGTVTANAGTGTFATSDSNLVAQASTTSGQKGPLAQGAVTTAAPTYTTGQTDPLSLTTAGALRVDGSATTQPVSGTVTTSPPANASTNVTQFGGNAVATGTGASGVGIPRVTVANDSNILASQSGTWNIGALSSITNPLPAGTAIIGKVGIDQTTPGTTNGVQVNGALPAGANTIGAVNQGTANTAANAWPHKITDGTNTAVVKPASTPPAATDPALVVTVSPNSMQGAASDRNVTGSLVNANDTVVVNTQGMATVGWVTSGVWVGTLVQEVSYDTTGTTWFPVQTFDSNITRNVLIPSTNLNSPTGQWSQGLNNDPWITNVAGAQQFRLRAVSMTSGTVTVTLNASVAPGPSAVFQTNANNLKARLSDGTTDTSVTTAGGLQVNLRRSDGQELGGQSSPLMVSLAPQLPAINTNKLLGGGTSGVAGGLPLTQPQQGPSGWERAQVVSLSPNPSLQCPFVAPINSTASVVAIPGRPGKRTMICTKFLVVAGAEGLSLAEGTGSVCGTGTTFLSGGSGGTIQFSANNGFIGDSDRVTLPLQTVGDDLCVIKSAANNVSGHFTYGYFNP